MKVLASRDVEEKFHVADLCRDFQRLAVKPTDVAFEHVQDCQALVVMVRSGCGPKAALKRLSDNLLRMADEAAALADALPDDPLEVIIDEKNKAVIER